MKELTRKKHESCHMENWPQGQSRRLRYCPFTLEDANNGIPSDVLNCMDQQMFRHDLLEGRIIWCYLDEVPVAHLLNMVSSRVPLFAENSHRHNDAYDSSIYQKLDSI